MRICPKRPLDGIIRATLEIILDQIILKSKEIKSTNIIILPKEKNKVPNKFNSCLLRFVNNK